VKVLAGIHIMRAPCVERWPLIFRSQVLAFRSRVRGVGHLTGSGWLFTSADLRFCS